MTGKDDSKKLLGRNPSDFAELFDKLDIDKDGLLNATELRGLFSFLFDDFVSNEHLFHFENRYLLLYGENGCLSKAKFLAILEDYEKAVGYRLDEDIAEFYQNFATDSPPSIHVDELFTGISTLLPSELVPKLTNFKEYLAISAKSYGDGAKISFEGFKAAVRKCFSLAEDAQTQRTSQSEVAAAPSSVRHPFYRDMLADRVARYERGLSNEAVRNLLHRLNQEFPRHRRGSVSGSSGSGETALTWPASSAATVTVTAVKSKAERRKSLPQQRGKSPERKPAE